MAALMSKAGASVGYTAGNIIKIPFDKVFNSVSKQYDWVQTGAKPVPPSVAANVTDSAASGLFNQSENKIAEEKKK